MRRVNFALFLALVLLAATNLSFGINNVIEGDYDIAAFQFIVTTICLAAAALAKRLHHQG